MFTRKDLFFSIITGLITGFLTWQIFDYLHVPEICRTYSVGSSSIGSHDLIKYCSESIAWEWLVLIVPILWILGVLLGYFLGRWFQFFNQFGKFAAVGFTNAAVYFGILNTLISWSDINKGLWYSVFVAIAFIIGTTHSYFWNKFWVFDVAAGKITSNEFGKFFAVYIVAGLINVGIASGAVNFIDPLFGFTPDQWANVGGVAGSAVALIASFAGVKLTVFKP